MLQKAFPVCESISGEEWDGSLHLRNRGKSGQRMDAKIVTRNLFG